MGGAPAPGWRRRRREARGLAVPPGPAVALPPLPPPPPRGRRRSFRRYPLSAPPPGPALRRSRAERRSVPTCRRRARAPPPGPAAAAARGAPQRPARARCRAAGPWRRAAVTRVLGRGRAAAGGSGAPGAALGPAPCPASLRSFLLPGPPRWSRPLRPSPPPRGESPPPRSVPPPPPLPPAAGRAGPGPRQAAVPGPGRRRGGSTRPGGTAPSSPRGGGGGHGGTRAAARTLGEEGGVGRRWPGPVGSSRRGSAGPTLPLWAAGPGSLRATLRAHRAGPPPPAVWPEPASEAPGGTERPPQLSPAPGGWQRDSPGPQCVWGPCSRPRGLTQ